MAVRFIFKYGNNSAALHRLMSYQVYTELILFVTSMISGLLPTEKNMVVMKIVGIVHCLLFNRFVI